MTRRILLAWVALGCRAGEPPHCSEAHAPRLAVFADSTVDEHRVREGKPEPCSAAPELHAALIGALALLPAELVPARVLVHLEPQWETRRVAAPLVEFHEPSRSLLVGRRAPGELDPSVWLHELVHVKAAGARPESKPARRLYRALEEGIADYVAATLRGDARVGSERAGELRDLEKPPRIGAAQWASLGLSASFPAHRVGHALAGALFRATPRPDPSGLVQCLNREAPFPAENDTPKEMLDELLARCGEPSRAALRAAIAEVVPAELRGG